MQQQVAGWGVLRGHELGRGQVQHTLSFYVLEPRDQGQGVTGSQGPRGQTAVAQEAEHLAFVTLGHSSSQDLGFPSVNEGIGSEHLFLRILVLSNLYPQLGTQTHDQEIMSHVLH